MVFNTTNKDDKISNRISEITGMFVKIKLDKNFQRNHKFFNRLENIKLAQTEAHNFIH